MARPPKEDWVPLMRDKAVERLKGGNDVKIMDIAEDLGTSPALVHFYFGDRRKLLDEAWRQILTAFVEEDHARIADLAERRDWEGVADLIGEIFSPERDSVRLAHLRAAAEGHRSEDLALTLAEVHEATIGAWLELMRQSMDRGVISTPLDLRAIATLIVAVPIGLTAVVPTLAAEVRAQVATAYTAMLRSVLDPDYSAHAGQDVAS